MQSASAVALGDRHLAVVDVDLPLPGAVDVEEVGRGHAPPSSTGRRASRGSRRTRVLSRPFVSPSIVSGRGRRADVQRARDGSRLKQRAPRLERRQEQRASARPSTGATAQTSSAARRSIESATAPSATAAIPPRPIDSPIERPDAMPIRLGRYCWLITIVTPNVPITQQPTPASAIAPGTPPTRMKTRISGGHASRLPISTGRSPTRSASGPAAIVPSAADEQHQREQVVAVRLRVAERDLPERDEGDEAEPGDAAEADHAEEEDERAARSSSPALRARATASVAKPCRNGRARSEDQRDHEARHHQEQAALEALPEHERRRQDRPERVAEVAADGEERHPARAALPARVGGELRALGVVRGDADAGDDHEQHDEPVARRVGGERDPDPRHGDPGGHQPVGAAAVGPEAEQRLDQRAEEPPRRASAPPRACSESPKRSLRNGSSAGSAPFAKSTARWPPARAVSARRSSSCLIAARVSTAPSG